MSFLDAVNKLSYAKVLSIGLFLSLLFGIPILVLMVQQQTRIASRAYKKPEQMVQAQKSSPGPIPVQPPQIGRIFPWIGKVGDIVWVQGGNFGNNPINKSLTIGGIIIRESDITGWRDDQIQAIIPQGASQGGTVEVKVAQHPVSQSLPIVIYDRDTKVRLIKRGTVITALSGGQIGRVKAWTGDENTPTEMVETDLIGNPGGETPLFDTNGQPLLTLLLYDTKGNILPYYVDPIEFGF